METLGRLGVGGLWCVSLLIKVLCALSDAWDWGNGFSSVDGVICFGSFLFNPWFVWSWFDSSCGDLLISLNSWIVVWWWFAYYFTVSGVLVVWLWFIGWRMKWLWWRGGVGWIVRRGSGLTGVVVALFDVNHGIWVNRVTLTLPACRGSW